ncbi:unnamed protein product [Arctogadus glacialis]
MRCHSVTWSPEEAPVANQTPRSLSEEAEGHTPLGPGFEKPTSQQGPTSEASIEKLNDGRRDWGSRVAYSDPLSPLVQDSLPALGLDPKVSSLSDEQNPYPLLIDL